MKPTMHLRWKSVSTSVESQCGGRRRLEQWWESTNSDHQYHAKKPGEWRDVPVGEGPDPPEATP